MQDLPIYPERPAQAAESLERRRARLDELRRSHASAYKTALERCLIEAVRETLGLTGAPLSMKEIERSAGNLEGGGGGDPLVRSQIEALRLIESSALGPGAISLKLVTDVQRSCDPGASGAFRSGEAPKQFLNARSSPPSQIGARLNNLLEWLASQTGRDMKVAERCALFFARYLEIAPFERKNFRSAHLLANHFALEAGYPAICLRLEDADVIREEVEKAMQFDTESLVRRFESAIAQTLERCEALLGVNHS